VQVVPVRIAFFEPLDAIGLAVNGNDSLAVEQHSSEVPRPQPNLDYPPPNSRVTSGSARRIISALDMRS